MILKGDEKLMQKIQKVKLTNCLRENITELRKLHNKKSVSLSIDLGKGASYISQLENGKIKDIEFDMLNNIFQHIVNLYGAAYDDFFKNFVLNILGSITKDELLSEDWIHLYVMQDMKVNISDNLVEWIKNKLDEVNCSPETLVKQINKNENISDGMKYPPNKLFIVVSKQRFDDYYISTSIYYELPLDYVSQILERKCSSISYIYLYGMVQTLFLFENNFDFAGSIEKTDILMPQFGFYNAIDLQNILFDKSNEEPSVDAKCQKNESDFIFYDDVIINYNEKFEQLKTTALNKVSAGFDRYKEENPSYACEMLEKIIINMDNDPGLILVLLSSPLYDIEPSLKRTFWNQYKKLISHFSQKNI